MKQEERQYNIMVYGIEKIGLTKPTQEISNSNFKLFFEHFKTEKRFNDFDGVILFQGIFETFEREIYSTGTYLKHSCDRYELDKRKKEFELLIKKGGFVCFILNRTFIEDYYNSAHNYINTGDTDFSKYILNIRSFTRKNFENRITQVNSLRDEFTEFLDLHGAASSYFINENIELDWRIIAKYDNYVVGMILFNQVFFIPSIPPEKTDDRILEYFTLLAEALTSSFNKLRVEIPSWLAQFSFEKEKALAEKKQQLQEEIENIDSSVSKYTKFKKILLGSGDILVEHVANVLKNGFSFKINYEDEFKEDLKIINDDNEPIIFFEVKGTNRGVKREYINQTDSHRDRAGLDADFPSLLLINTHIKKSASIEDKDQTIPEDQIRHAVKIGVLILRTLDLLFLFKQLDNGKISQDEIVEIFCNNVGWLKADADHWKIINV